jgi:hypothetical protein
MGGWMPCLALPCPIMAGGAWLIRDPCPWMLVKILVAFVSVHRFLLKACGFLPGRLGPAWVGAAADLHTHDQVIITVGDEMSLCSWVYVVGHACLIVCQVMSAPTFVAAMLVMPS